MGKRIVIIQGHPDPNPHHYGHALAAAYAEGARSAGHDVVEIRIADLDLPYLRTHARWLAPTDLEHAAKKWQRFFARSML